MKAELQFDLSDTDDKHAFIRCVHADNACAALWEIQAVLRLMRKSGELEGVSGETALDTITERICDVIADNATAALDAYR